ncbi:MAG: hypothetical protein Q9M39_07670 [Sulfurovum sp.]|nr:hypothetical protein [Sulfurovum sp.]
MIDYKHILLGLTAVMLISGCEIGEDDDGDDILGSHNQGKDCKVCHANFTASGTVFTKIDAADGDSNLAAANHTLKLALEEGTGLVLIKGYGSGNARTTTNTDTVGSFTAQVLDAGGKVINSSNTLSHDGDMLRCNMCHTQTGINGAPGRITNFRP